MIQGLDLLGQALAGFLTLDNLFNTAWATLLGIVIGALPGLTATMGVALMTTLTYRMSPDGALLILTCMYVGAIFGGSRSAILLNIPGTPANAATALDGFPLAQSGEAGRALGIATTGSALGTIVGMLFLAVTAPYLADLALRFGAFEFFWLAVFGIVISGQLTAIDDPLKGWIAGFLGLLIAMIGQEGIHAYARFSFGITDLTGGIGLIPALVGAFGFAEVLTVMKNPAVRVVQSGIGSVVPRLGEVLRYWRTIGRSGILGTVVGIIPGVGEDVAAWVSYAAARRASRERERFGKGSVEGLMAAETGNNACVPGALIPVLTLGVPGSAPAAVLLAAMIIHGVRPGPMIMLESPRFVFDVVVMILFATLGLVVFGFVLTRPLLKVLAVPRERLMPVIFVLCTIGSYAITSRLFEVWVMLAFGVVGFLMREMRYPMAPLVLGIILGDMLDKSLRRALVLTDGDLTPFFTRPISMALWLTTALTIALSIAPVRRRLAAGWQALSGRRRLDS